MARLLPAIVVWWGTLRGMARECTKASGKILFKVGAGAGSTSTTVAKQTS
jgi:hypothetical protein